MLLSNSKRATSFQKNVFTSKAAVLKFLVKKLTKAKIEKMYFFTISDWKNNKKLILNEVISKFKNKSLIVRSSAIGEDSLDESKAGEYKSIQNVPLKTKNLTQAINSVVNSYLKKGNRNLNNQILIQIQSKNIVTSGVVFTRTENNSPYYVINYFDGISTDKVTKGEINNIIKFFKRIKPNKCEKKWRLLIQSLHEVESLLGSDSLDIEFGLTKSNQVIIFQVRPITIQHEFDYDITTTLSTIIEKNRKKLSKLNSSVKMNGFLRIFSDMSDWNPAEIIGNDPNLLDYSLYDYLIMKDAWREGRSLIGYTNVSPLNLMTKFGNKPYVDILASFSSMIPNNISKPLQQKLIKFYIRKLRNNLHLHDKVEFDILFSCYDITIKKRMNELSKSGFTKKEINSLQSSLKEFTNKIINDFPNTVDSFKESIDIMVANRKSNISKIQQNESNPIILLDAAEQLLKDCKTYGTTPFSAIARIAFISSILLKSLLQEEHITNKQYTQIMNSVKTPLSDLQKDSQKFFQGRLSEKEFLQKYGHLRPGTYDITASRYDTDKQMISNFQFLKPKPNSKHLGKSINLDLILTKHGLKFNKINFLNFLQTSLSQREYLKFEFTRNVSDAIELIAKVGKIFGFSREEMAHLDLKTIFSHKKINKNQLKSKWKKMIEKERKIKNINSFLQLPPIILSEEDFEKITYFVAKPNFVTNKSITKNVVILDKHEIKKNLHDKIVVTEQADPGFDWIFTHNPAGLITKYGGVASHMAIRCSEIGLPAAIGCGELIYNQLVYSSKILLDCKNNQIIILESKNADEFFEEKKILKSLGYIK